MNDILWLLNLAGITIGPKVIAVGFSIGMVGVATIKFKIDSLKKKNEEERITKAYEEMELEKKKMSLELWDEEQQKRNNQIKLAYDQMNIDKKERELQQYKLVEVTCDLKYPYKGIRPPTMKHLLLGHNVKGEPIWGDRTNYIVAGTTGAGKTRKLYPLVLNYLANQQGILFIGDLKGTDFFMFKNKRYVMQYVNELENAAELIKAFEKEYEERKILFSKGGFIDLDDYNKRTNSNMRLFMLVIDEYADIADVFHDKNGRPIGIYADIVRLARKVRAYGGRIILGTQRPDATVICGQLKNNCSVLGLQCVNSISSNVMIGMDGCERLNPTESLIVMNGVLTKVFAYDINNERLENYSNKLK